MGNGEFNAGSNPAMDQHLIQRGVEILLVASCYRNRDKFRPDGPLGSYADFTYLYLTVIQQASTMLVWLAFCVFYWTIHNLALALDQLFIKVFNQNHVRCK